jgi:soluble lytic murein transglycosylase-like protein
MAIRRPFSVVLLAACLLASCSGDDASPPDASPPDAARPPTTTPPSAPPVRTAFDDPFAAARSYDVASPEELGTRLTTAEALLRAPATNDADATEQALVQQAAYRQLVRTPAWRETVYRRLPTDIVDVVRANVRAGAELRAITAPRDDLPPWRIVEPPPPDELLAAYKHAERSLGVGWEYLAAIHLTETRMGRIRGTSTAGAKGPMQFLPSTWEAYGEGDINDPDDAIMAAARYLADHGAPGNMDRALFAYNHSEHYVTAVSIYAKLMRADPLRYRAYHAWQVYYRTTTKGDALLYEGWPRM